LADGECQTVDHRYKLDLHSKTELRIQVKVLQFDNAYLSKVVNDKKSWFTQKEVLDLIYHQFFFAANSSISKMEFSHWEPPGVSERMCSVNLDALISGECQTVGGHSSQPSE